MSITTGLKAGVAIAVALLWAAPAGAQLLHPMFQDHARPAARSADQGLWRDDARRRRDGDDWHRQRSSARRGRRPLERHAAADAGRRSVHVDCKRQTAKPERRSTCSSATSSSVPASRTWHSASDRPHGAADDARTATDGQIRQLTMPTNASLTPRQTFTTAVRWVVGSPAAVGAFSAACYYFARELKKTINVPVGMVVAACGGARVRNCMSEEALRNVGLDNDDLDILALSRTDQQAALRRWGAKWESWWNAVRPKDGQPWMPEYNDTSWKTAPPALGAWALWNGTNPDGFVGQMWMRTTVTLTAEQAANAGAVLDLGSVNEEDETWVNGKDVGRFVLRQSHAVSDPSPAS